MKYQISDAAIKRIAVALVADEAPTRFESFRSILKAEEIAGIESSMGEVISRLGAAGHVSLAISLGAMLARELYYTRNIVRDIVRGQEALNDFTV